MTTLQSLFSIKRSLRFHMLATFGGLLLTTVLVVVFYFYSSTSRMVLMLCDNIMEQTTQAVINRTINFFSPMTALTEMSSRIAAEKILPCCNSKTFERYAVEILNAYPTVARFIVGDQEGNFFLARRLPDGSSSTKIMDHTSNPPLTTWRTWDKDFNLIKTENTTEDPFDPRLRPWYEGAIRNHGLYLTDLYIFYTDGVPGITLSYPLLDSSGAVLGVMGCDIELSGLSAFLESLQIGKHGLAFIVSEKDSFVAFPHAAGIIDKKVDHGVLRTVTVEDMDPSGIAEAFKKYRLTGQARVAVEAEGQKYLATFRDFPPSFPRPWKVVVVVPENDFIGEVKKQNRDAFLICLGILGVSTLLVIFLSRSISKPVLQLAVETDRIRNFDLEDRLYLRTHISEIGQLRGAVERMKVSLLSFIRFAPEQIVKEVVVNGREVMLGGERRDVTLLFSDLRYFTRFSEQTRPEQVVKMLNTHFDAMVRIIANHRGFVVDFLGDSLFAVFGAPDEDPDHAVRAVSCAIEMQLARRQMNYGPAHAGMPPMEMGIGINSGFCIVGNIGSYVRIKYGVVGHAVNLASRVESFSVGGQVLISESTLEATRDRFDIFGPMEVHGKGVESAIRLWEVRGIPNDTDKRLVPTISKFSQLVIPVPVRIRLVTDKKISPSLHEGRLLRLSAEGAEFETKLSLGIFASIQMDISCLPGKDALIDGKIVGFGDLPDSYIVKFSTLDYSALAALTCLLKPE